MTAFTQKRYAEALVAQEHAAQLGADVPEVLYDLAVIRLAAGKKSEALEALRRAIALNAKLKTQARKDKDLDALRDNPELTKLIQ